MKQPPVLHPIPTPQHKLISFTEVLAHCKALNSGFILASIAASTPASLGKTTESSILTSASITGRES